MPDLLSKRFSEIFTESSFTFSGISSTIGFSSNNERTLSPLASVWFRLLDRLDNTTTGPKDPIIAMVQVRIPSNPSSPLPYSHIVSASIPKDASRITIFVKDLWEPSCLFKLLCIFARFPERCDICSFRLSPCPYWIVSSRPRRESRTKLFSSPKFVRNSIPIWLPRLPFHTGIATPTIR